MRSPSRLTTIASFDVAAGERHRLNSPCGPPLTVRPPPHATTGALVGALVIRWLIVGLVCAALPGSAAAQRRAPDPGIIGTWKVNAKELSQRKDAPRVVIVRPDSSASWGTETARWRLKGDRLWLAIGGEWEDYRLKLKGQTLTLSEGDLTRPVSFERIGPATPRPAHITVPPDPDAAGG
jgi:hypothetical protein